MGRRNPRTSEQMIARARELRRESTFPERLLWGRLRNGRRAGLKFVRLAPPGRAACSMDQTRPQPAGPIPGTPPRPRGSGTCGPYFFLHPYPALRADLPLEAGMRIIDVTPYSAARSTG